MRSKRNDAERFSEILDENTKRSVKDLLESLGVLIKKRGRILSVDNNTNFATVCFDGDTGESCSFKNCSGEQLADGDIVYVFCQYNKEAQGQIMIKG